MAYVIVGLLLYPSRKVGSPTWQLLYSLAFPMHSLIGLQLEASPGVIRPVWNGLRKLMEFFLEEPKR